MAAKKDGIGVQNCKLWRLKNYFYDEKSNIVPSNQPNKIYYFIFIDTRKKIFSSITK